MCETARSETLAPLSEATVLTRADDRTGERNPASVNENQKMKDVSPIACVIGALTEDEIQRHVELGKIIRKKKVSVSELENGYSIEFSDTDVWTMATEFVTLESRCCSFFSFTLVWEAENAGMRIEVTGREGTKEFLKAEMNLNQAMSETSPNQIGSTSWREPRDPVAHSPKLQGDNR